MKMRYLLAAFLLAAAGLARAQEPAPKPAQETAPPAGEQRNGAAAPRKPVRPKSGEFLPSEEISADSAVSFPVDI